MIGGVVGTGKSSQVEIATNYAIKNPLIIHVKFCLLYTSEYDPADYLPVSDKDVEVMYKELMGFIGSVTVSYTHLDVYKRQILSTTLSTLPPVILDIPLYIQSIRIPKMCIRDR